MCSESHRHYHNCLHIAGCPHEFDQVRKLAADALAVELAIWFHDAVYDPLAADNEECSAELAKDWMGKFGTAAALDGLGGTVDSSNKKSRCCVAR